jgi:hypothetical protein
MTRSGRKDVLSFEPPGLRREAFASAPSPSAMLH